MKWIIASDVHGYPERCRKIAELTEKEGTYPGYMLMEDGVFFWRDLDGNTVMRCDVNA